MQMLADAGDYIRAWQFPLYGVFIFGWLVGGGYLFHRTLSAKVDSRRGVSVGRGVLISLLSGIAGAIAGAVLFKVGSVTMPPSPAGGLPVSILGVALGVVAYAVVAWLVVFAMHKLSAGEVLSASALPIGATIGLAMVVGLACAIPAAAQVRKERAQYELMWKNQSNMSLLYRYWIYRQGPNEPVGSLVELIASPSFDESLLKNPARPDMNIGYFYHPAPNSRIQANVPTRLLMCDYANTYGNDNRIVLNTQGETNTLNEATFQRVLGEEQNAAFAEALRQAESKLTGN
jgi:hypothetical protein